MEDVTGVAKMSLPDVRSCDLDSDSCKDSASLFSDKEIEVFGKLRGMIPEKPYLLQPKDIEVVKKWWMYIRSEEYDFTFNDEGTKLKKHKLLRKRLPNKDNLQNSNNKR